MKSNFECRRILVENTANSREKLLIRKKKLYNYDLHWHDCFEIELVLDATTGQNAVNQAEEFDKVANITGIVLTKLDGTAKGGVVVNICKKLGVPVKFVGVGEGIDDLQEFDPESFAAALFGDE